MIGTEKQPVATSGSRKMSSIYTFAFLIAFILSFSVRNGHTAENSQNSQVKFALKAAHGSKVRCFGLSCTDGAVLVTAARDEDTICENPEGSDRRTFPLLQGTRLLRDPVKHLFRIDSSLSVALTGIPSDCRHILRILREGAQDYRLNFGEPIPAAVLADQVSAYLHDLTLSYDTRPLAVTVLIAARANQQGCDVRETEEEGSWTPSLGGEIVKISCDGSYDFYFCCGTDSAHSAEEEISLTLKLQGILWSKLSISEASAKLLQVLSSLEIEETGVEIKKDESSTEEELSNSMKRDGSEMLPGSSKESKVLPRRPYSYSILEVMTVNM